MGARLWERAQGPLRRPGQQGRVHEDGVRHPRCRCGKDVRPRLVARWCRQGARDAGRSPRHEGRRHGRLRAVVPVLPGHGEAYEKFAADAAAKGITVAKYRGDEDRDFVQSKFNTESFPTINVIKGGKATKYESEDRSVEALAALV